ncbi:Serine/threonine protein phosphatase PP1-2, putative [Trichomonas vaginalis G3]|uniref:Serine/threonine-protein phosphatase n=1 Tax=Trichomonas vaginalis (strain ATCC PRA-98 / G3) TaxID=412133 RepID=A2DNI2_TRIV3|nr:phosphoprotein phosphatase protein [Trichomonas vaginalis G3]EAY17985.1 Serine/threonine protein phosphatase PP1-2, putative [Trichomonas vaginalis G3]KAI5499069.1 phosphoprotein phosphatase protein [Trichomonas vaginalis G3]|eukprot:XP_001578971.1 Serine/threonine protein phosphatase PP1-2 [Trichomonas vaginalis G3]
MKKVDTLATSVLHQLSKLKPGKLSSLPITDIQILCKEVKRIIMSQPVLLNLEAPCTIFGDLHGQYYDMYGFLQKAGMPPEKQILFLGDYVDRGKNSIEILLTLFCLKIKFPEKIWTLRGNHECKEISKQYGFHEECMTRYDESIWDTFNDVFDYFPIAAIIGGKIFCVHGGLSPQLSELSQIATMQRPITIPERGLIADLVWADPSPSHDGWHESDRGTSYTFGPDVVDAFLAKNNFDLICRAHQVTAKGYEFPFFPNRSTVTVFSAPCYCNEYNNCGAIMSVAKDLRCSFVVIEPDPPAGKILLSVPEYRDF